MNTNWDGWKKKKHTTSFDLKTFARQKFFLHSGVLRIPLQHLQFHLCWYSPDASLVCGLKFFCLESQRRDHNNNNSLSKANLSVVASGATRRADYKTKNALFTPDLSRGVLLMWKCLYLLQTTALQREIYWMSVTTADLPQPPFFFCCFLFVVTSIRAWTSPSGVTQKKNLEAQGSAKLNTKKPR